MGEQYGLGTPRGMDDRARQAKQVATELLGALWADLKAPMRRPLCIGAPSRSHAVPEHGRARFTLSTRC